MEVKIPSDVFIADENSYNKMSSYPYQIWSFDLRETGSGIASSPWDLQHHAEST